MALQIMSSLSRNRFLVRALDAQEQTLGEIEVKDGMVLRAQAGDRQGRKAVPVLLKDPLHLSGTWWGSMSLWGRSNG